MRRRDFITLVGAAAAMSAVLWPFAGRAQQLAGAWRATNECFLIAFVLIEGSRAQTAYLSGERDDNAVWTWNGRTLRITSATFPLDRFTGHLTNDHVEVDYVWHDLERDQLNSQTCVFERFAPFGRGAGRLPFMRPAANSGSVIKQPRDAFITFLRGAHRLAGMPRSQRL